MSGLLAHPIAKQRELFLDMVLQNPYISQILEVLEPMNIPNCYLTGGSVFQTVWNALSGNEPMYGIKDYDVFYFDDSDLSYEAEDAVIKAVARATKPIQAEIEVKNEARVHLWYKDKFGSHAPAFVNCEDAIDHFVSYICCYGIRKTPEGIVVYAPHGYNDLFTMTMRPNAKLDAQATYDKKSVEWQHKWPKLTVEPWLAR
jgi:uncharacterized protein